MLEIVKKVKYILLIIIITGTYMLIRTTRWNLNEYWIERGMAAILLGILLYQIYLAIRKKWTEHSLFVSIILAGCVMRIGYMLYTGCEVRSHDMYDFSSQAYGHAGYLLTLMETHKLPETNLLQMYQQPLFYIVGAIVSKFVNGMLHSDEAYYLVDATKLVSCFASCATIFVTTRICETLNLKGKGKLVAVGIVAFLPSFYLIGGRVNCDALAIWLMALAIYYTLRWRQQTNWLNTILLAFIYGFGMMTKISCGTVAIVTAAVFVGKLVEKIREKKVVSLIIKYIVFGIISLPLGLWYSVRNYKKFGQSLTYVLMQNEESTLYCGNHSFIQRFLSLNIKNLFTTPYAQPFGDYNFPTYTIKSALFGEFQFAVSDAITGGLLVAGTAIAILIAWSFLSQCKRCLQNGQNQDTRWLIGFQVIFLLSSVIFCMKYAFGCSMDFRYYGILAILGAVLLGDWMEHTNREAFVRISGKAVVVFGILSCIMYVLV